MRTPLAAAALALVLAAACSPANDAMPPAQAPVAPAPASASAPAASTPPPAPKTDADAFLDECHGHIDAARALVAQILASKDPRTVQSTLEPYNTLSIHLSNAGNKAGTLSQVHPDPAFRAAAEQCVKDVSSYSTEISQNPDLYAAIKAVDISGADDVTKRMVAHTLLDFRRTGVDRDEATRKHLKDLSDEMTATGLEFDKNIREDVHSVKLDPKQLAGLPDDYVKAHAPGADGKVTITSDYPDYIPFRKYAEDAQARKALYVEFLNRGYPKNDDVLHKLLRERHEFATTLGYKDWADYDTEEKMIKNGQAAADFIDKITKAAAKRGKHDYDELLARKRKDQPGAKSVEDWESAFYSEKVSREQYAFDSQAVRPYFEFTQTRDGLLAITAQMYGIEYRPAADAPRWDPSVDVYDVYAAGGGDKLGRIYLDLHPRAGKYKHAANFDLVKGVKGVQLPESALVCNFPDPAKGEAFMEHADVVTMFHEFGHMMHGILGGQQHWVMFSGVATEWDFVEAPSQMFEEWAWDPAVLATFAKNAKTHEPIPAALVKKMRRADEFGKGASARRQMFLAALSLDLYREADPDKVDLVPYMKNLQAKYSMFPYVDGSHFYDNFGHLNGYAASYYTYMWSLVIAKDLLTAFKVHGLMDPDTDHRYRDQILAKGGTRDAAALVHDFLGRDYGFKAYEAWLNAE
ncbi:MAG TPA: M3 family metallopeptidase [Polyangiaceae bacterium]